MSYPVNLRITGVVTTAPRVTFTRSGAPRAAFNVVVRGVTANRRHHVVAYATVARFCDRYVVPGQRVQVDGTSVPKSRFPRELRGVHEPETVILARSIREVARKPSVKSLPAPALSTAAAHDGDVQMPAVERTPDAATLPVAA